MTIHVATTFRNSMVDIIGDLADAGFIDIYDSSQPANANTAVSGQTKLARCTFNAAAFPGASSGSAAANSITSGTGLANGTASWFRVLKSDGTTVLFDGSVGTSGADLNLSTVAIVSNATIAISSFTMSIAA